MHRVTVIDGPLPDRVWQPANLEPSLVTAPEHLAVFHCVEIVADKRRERGRVVRVTTRAVFGTAAAALAASTASTAVNTSFVERQNGTDRHLNARKGRKTYRFSKAVAPHDAATYYTMYGYNFCRPVRTLAERGGDGRRVRRTPAMAAGAGGPRLDDPGMGHVPGRSIGIGHQGRFLVRFKC